MFLKQHVIVLFFESQYTYLFQIFDVRQQSCDLKIIANFVISSSEDHHNFFCRLALS